MSSLFQLISQCMLGLAVYVGGWYVGGSLFQVVQLGAIGLFIIAGVLALTAGGTLTLLVTKALEMEGVIGPKCLVMMSPAFDDRLNSESVKRNRQIDPMINIEWGIQSFAWYHPQPGHPLAIPMRVSLAALPPTLVQVGEIEVLHDDSVWLLHAAKRFDRHVELEVYKDRWHVFQIHAGLMPSATKALERQAAFMKQHWAA